MFAPVIKSVIGRVPEYCPAAINGYRRLEVVGELFPGLVRAISGGKVEGVLYFNISESNGRILRRLRMISTSLKRYLCSARKY